MRGGRDSRQYDQLNMQQELDRPGKLMVSGIPKLKDYSDADLEKAFAPYGRVTEVYIIRDHRTKIPRGFAFVTYENPQDSEVAIKAMEGRDLGGECKVHCEQARIGLKKSMTMMQNAPGENSGRGNGRGRGRGNESYANRGGPRGGGMMDRGRGMMDRGRGMMDRGRGFMGRGMMDRGRGMMDRGRGMMNRGGMMDRGMPPMGRGMFDEEGFDYPEEEFYEEFYDLEPPHMRFPPSGGPGGLSMRGGLPGRGRHISQGLASLGGRKALLPDPSVRGGRIATYPGSLQGEDFYGDDSNEADYYGDNGNPYAESRGEAYPEDVDYPSEEYYDQEWQAQSRGRGAQVSRGRGVMPRGVPEARASRQQMEDYGYEAEGAPPQRSRATAPVSRRGAQAYAEELFDEEDIRLSGGAPDPYSVSRGRPSASAVQSASSARHERGNPAGRAGAASARRVGPLLEADPYAEDDGSLYDRVPTAALTGGAGPDYDDDPYADPYGQRVAAGGSRQTAAGRSRAAMGRSDAGYPGQRSQPKPLMGADAMTPRQGPGASRVDDDDDYQGQGILGAQPRVAYSEGRRPQGRRGDPDLGMIEEMYGRMAAETDDFASYPSMSRALGELFSDPYSRKRPVDPYEDPEMGGHARSAMRRDYEAAVTAPKRDRVDRGGDRGGYDPYGRQEAAYRGL